MIYQESKNGTLVSHAAVIQNTTLNKIVILVIIKSLILKRVV